MLPIQFSDLSGLYHCSKADFKADANFYILQNKTFRFLSHYQGLGSCYGWH